MNTKITPDHIQNNDSSTLSKQQPQLYKIISGGQTGADFGALEAAREIGLETGGFAPKGFMTEKGPNLSLKEYNLVEVNSTNYVLRTIKNVDNSDGTLAFRLFPSSGTDKTIGYCQTKKWKVGLPITMNIGETKYKPVCVITGLENEEQVISQIQQFVIRNQIACLNVAGHRQSSVTGMNFERAVRDMLIKAFYHFE